MRGKGHKRREIGALVFHGIRYIIEKVAFVGLQLEPRTLNFMHSSIRHLSPFLFFPAFIGIRIP
jgi:hypothetical protein